MPPEARTLDCIFYRHRQVMEPNSNVFVGKINEFESRCVRACFENHFSLTALRIALACKHSKIYYLYVQRNPIQKIVHGKDEGEAIEGENTYKEY